LIAPPVELLDRADQADGSLLDEIQEAEALAAVLLRDRHDETQVRLDHAPLGLEIALLDTLGELDLLDLGEKRIPADLVEEALERVGRALERHDALCNLALGDRSRLLDELDAMALELAIDVLELARIELALGKCLRDLDGAEGPALGARIDQTLQLGERFEISGKNHGVRLLLATADPCTNRRRDLMLLAKKMCGWP